MLSGTDVLGVTITNESKEKVLEFIIKGLILRRKKFCIVTPNPEMIVFSKTHPDFKKVLSEAEIALCDGVGVLLSSHILGHPLVERFSGTDLVENLCERVSKKPITVGFLGGRPGVAVKAAKCLREKYPGLRVVFTDSEWPKEELDSKEKYQGKRTDIQATHIDILFVAFGFPKQEYWIRDNLKNLPITAAVGVGGAFDYISGNVPRAPFLLRAIGLEWLFRLVVQPWRWRRQIALLQFVWLVITARIAITRTHRSVD